MRWCMPTLSSETLAVHGLFLLIYIILLKSLRTVHEPILVKCFTTTLFCLPFWWLHPTSKKPKKTGGKNTLPNPLAKIRLHNSSVRITSPSLTPRSMRRKLITMHSVSISAVMWEVTQNLGSFVFFGWLFHIYFPNLKNVLTFLNFLRKKHKFNVNTFPTSSQRMFKNDPESEKKKVLNPTCSMLVHILPAI